MYCITLYNHVFPLQKDAMMRDVILAIRADEAHHRSVHHTLSSLGTSDHNPFKPGSHSPGSNTKKQ